jgi:type IV secretory pathway protease TraF
MKKKMTALVMVAAFTVASVVVAAAFTCEVKAVDGGTVTLTCTDKNAAKVKAGDKVKVSPPKKALEGC